ncbi:C45 family autoproteolytic acyltransferase/hydolase [Fodinicola acaciae]|uniref:C45 family autoproteolytic acyltransferase/hydolase n=1 Tax=Fodinicola acaciae TaxID=2681555 RepID=UPI0013D16F94|nr:C45 family autoproteolytic acyltransferase/hydolase [Fodinicola acaciae]
MTTTSIVAGGRNDFMTVRHLVLRGGQREIGRALALDIQAASDWQPRAVDPLVSRARDVWFARNWPQHRDRMTGAAEVFQADPMSMDGMSSIAGSGCSATFCPPAASADGRGRLGRNYDFFTLSQKQLVESLSGAAPQPSDEPPMASRPYVITSYPDDGLASTVLTMSNVDGCMDGINEAGLAVVLLLADITATAPPDFGRGPQAGLDPTQVPRFLLDTCTSAAEARVALLSGKQYDNASVACHYLVADASGDGFVWERGAYDSEHIIPLADGPLCVTNHPLHKFPSVDDLPPDTPETFATYERLRTISKHPASSAAGIREALDEVAQKAAPGWPWRTLWRSVFDLSGRSMTTRFHLGEDAAGHLRHSEEIVFEVRR